jgi:predicted transcriptional regulator
MNISTYLPDDLLAIVDAFAARQSISRSAMIREGLELYLARHRSDGWSAQVRTWTGDTRHPLLEIPQAAQRIDEPFGERFATVVRAL